jgi:AraC family transcriptional regulator
MQWAGPRELFIPGQTQMITLYHDDPNVIEPDKLRMSICISVPAQTEVSGEIGKMTVAGGKYAISRFELRPDQYGDAWNAVYGGWLPDSGYQPDDRVAFERCPSDQDHSKETHVVEICVPVKPL